MLPARYDDDDEYLFRLYDIAIRAYTSNQPETPLHSLERAAAGIGLHVNAHKTEYMCCNQTGRSGERGSEISVLAARHDDHGDNDGLYNVSL